MRFQWCIGLSLGTFGDPFGGIWYCLKPFDPSRCFSLSWTTGSCALHGWRIGRAGYFARWESRIDLSQTLTHGPRLSPCWSHLFWVTKPVRKVLMKFCLYFWSNFQDRLWIRTDLYFAPWSRRGMVRLWLFVSNGWCQVFLTLTVDFLHIKLPGLCHRKIFFLRLSPIRLIFRKMETLNIQRPGCRTYIFIYTYVISFRPGLFLHCFFGIGAGCCRHRSWYGEPWTLWVDAGEPLRARDVIHWCTPLNEHSLSWTLAPIDLIGQKISRDFKPSKWKAWTSHMISCSVLQAAAKSEDQLERRKRLAQRLCHLVYETCAINGPFIGVLMQAWRLPAPS